MLDRDAVERVDQDELHRVCGEIGLAAVKLREAATGAEHAFDQSGSDMHAYLLVANQIYGDVLARKRSLAFQQAQLDAMRAQPATPYPLHPSAAMQSRSAEDALAKEAAAHPTHVLETASRHGVTIGIGSQDATNIVVSWSTKTGRSGASAHPSLLEALHWLVGVLDAELPQLLKDAETVRV